MRTSEQTGQIAAALAKAQAKMQPPKKDKTADAGTYKYHYSDLASLIDAIRGPLAENEIAFLQPLHQADGHLVLETLLIHSSGEWIASDYPIATYAKPQEQGSAITYARRYSLGTMVGLAPEDDDGAAAQAAEPRKAATPRKEAAAGLDAEILDVASSIVMTWGGNEDEIIGRASAFPKDDDGERTGAKRLDEIRWSAPRSDVLAPHNQYIKGADKLPPAKNAKWKKGTLARLIARRDALRAEPTDAEIEGRDAEAEAMQAQFDEVPF